MTMNAKPSEAVAILAAIDPDEYTAADATPLTSDEVDMSKWGALMAVISLGDVAATVSVNAKFQQATAAGGTYKDVTGTSVTALTGADDNKQVIINLRAEDLDIDNNYDTVKLSVTVSDSASPDAAVADVCATVLGFYPRFGPASDNDLASVDEIVN